MISFGLIAAAIALMARLAIMPAPLPGPWLTGFAFVSLVSAAGLFTWLLHSAAARSANPGAETPWAMITGAIAAYAAVTGVAHIYAWVPLPLAGAIASPCVLLPSTIFFIRATPRPPADPLPLTMEERCRVQENAVHSIIIRMFMQRYPDAQIYLYKRNNPYTTGGLLLHNRERLNVLPPTWLDVTLDCPFASKLGVLTEGRESFRAYFFRLKEGGSVIHPLPHDNWEDWLEGLTHRDWMERIQELDNMPTEHPEPGVHPFQIVEARWPWRRFSLYD